MHRRQQLGRERRDTEDSLQQWRPGSPRGDGKEPCVACLKLKADLKAKETECASLEAEGVQQAEELDRLKRRLDDAERERAVLAATAGAASGAADKA